MRPIVDPLGKPWPEQLAVHGYLCQIQIGTSQNVSGVKNVTGLLDKEYKFRVLIWMMLV